MFDVYRWVKAFAERHGLNEQTVLNMQRDEYEELRKTASPRAKLADIDKTACENIEGWFVGHDQFVFNDEDLMSLADFVANHRQACAWAVLAGRAKAAAAQGPTDKMH
jgi:hypothetical protein